MTFNSLTFAAFLAITLLVYWGGPRRARLPVLLVASYLFYSAWDWRFLGLIIISTVVDYLVGRGLGRTDDQRRRRQLLAVSLTVNLGMLGIFKYLGFFVESSVSFLQNLGVEANQPVLEILLPLGISFYTFQTLSYTIDVYRRRIDPCDRPVLFAVFVAYFPQLVAGPIERASHLLPQLAADNRPPNGAQLQSAFGLIATGLVKKVVIADQLAPLVNEAWADPGALGWLGALSATVAFALQINGDFAGYTDMARGVSRLLSVNLVTNFEEPYLAMDFTALWRRWHTSLTTWLRDYVYIPLGGNRGSRRRVNLNTMLTWFITGMWHGATWMFGLWGLLNGLLLIGHRRLKRTRAPRVDPPRVVKLLKGAGTFMLFAITFISFRAPDWDSLWVFVGQFTDLSGSGLAPWELETVLGLLGLTLAIDVFTRHRRLNATKPLAPAAVGALAGLAVVAIFLSSGNTPTDFIYFQF